MIAELISAVVACLPTDYLATNKVVFGLPNDKAQYPQLVLEESWFSVPQDLKGPLNETVLFNMSVFYKRQNNGLVEADQFAAALSASLHNKSINGLFIRVIGREPLGEPDTSLGRIQIQLSVQRVA